MVEKTDDQIRSLAQTTKKSMVQLVSNYKKQMKSVNMNHQMSINKIEDVKSICQKFGESTTTTIEDPLNIPELNQVVHNINFDNDDICQDYFAVNLSSDLMENNEQDRTNKIKELRSIISKLLSCSVKPKGESSTRIIEEKNVTHDLISHEKYNKPSSTTISSVETEIRFQKTGAKSKLNNNKTVDDIVIVSTRNKENHPDEIVEI
ncbi:hypothetical protein M153_11700010983 [Pseudoloma neurophilia]|uniref:Uncharacterized protein n=1 Tax=Pseudoloma neurophilia TaxID=146866 RepID=A0A0R0M0L9_9MICR|nr:hypothetical protein M153_11700010983 [Pseudoloma neurophilia]